MNRITENVIETLKSRNMIDALSSEDVKSHLSKPQTVYCGFDPTAESLHLGNLAAIVMLRHFQLHGHTPVVLIGGATGLVGDPSGKDIERPLLSEETIRKNAQAIKSQVEQLLPSEEGIPKPIFVNNIDWYSPISVIDFLRDAGKHFRLGTMLSKESVKNRLNSSEGMSFTEFSYQMLQAYDFYHLNIEFGCTIQIGGSDQWGNITAGIEFMRKKKSGNVFGITFPLLTSSNGKKFGKSEKGALWLQKELLSPFELHQYIIGLPDSDVVHIMRSLTFLDVGTLQLEEEAILNGSHTPQKAQKMLSEALIHYLHGNVGVSEVKKAQEALSTEGSECVNLEELSKSIPSITLKYGEFVSAQVTSVLVKFDQLKSKSRISKLIEGGGVRINGIRVLDKFAEFSENDSNNKTFCLVSVGKKQKYLIILS